MKTSAILGLSVLLCIWMWLAWILLSSSGLTLKNLLVLAMSAIIIFVPLVRKFSDGHKKD